MHTRRIPPGSEWERRFEDDEETPAGVHEVKHVGGGSVTLARGDTEIAVDVRQFLHRWRPTNIEQEG